MAKNTPKNTHTGKEPSPIGEIQDEAANEGVQLPVAWVGLDEMPVITVNQILSQFHQDQFIVSFGMFVPPPLLGATAAERHEQLSRLGVLPITPAIRIGLTPIAMEQFIGALTENLARYRASKSDKDEE